MLLFKFKQTKQIKKMLYITILLSLVVSLSFGNLQASYISSGNAFINRAETSLDFSKEHPYLEGIYFDFRTSLNKERTQLEHFYLNQTSDLNLSKNKNLESIWIHNTAKILQFLQKSYLPQVKRLYIHPSPNFWDYIDVFPCSNWDYLAAFPNLRTLVSDSQLSLDHLVCYTPLLETLEISGIVSDFTEKELDAIAQLKELKKFTYNFEVFDSLLTIPPDVQEIEQKMRTLFPYIEINFRPYFKRIYEPKFNDLCA